MVIIFWGIFLGSFPDFILGCLIILKKNASEHMSVRKNGFKIFLSFNHPDVDNAIHGLIIGSVYRDKNTIAHMRHPYPIQSET